MSYHSIHSSSQIIQRLNISQSVHTQPIERRKEVLNLIKQNQTMRSKSQSNYFINKGKRKPSIVKYLRSQQGRSPQKYYNYLLDGNLIPKLKQLNPASLQVIKIFSSNLRNRNKRLPRITQQILSKSNIKL